jgi:hypothetical protein
MYIDGTTNGLLVYGNSSNIVCNGVCRYGEFSWDIFRLDAHDAKFQYNHITSQARHYKRKCLQQRVIIEKLKSECENHANLQRYERTREEIITPRLTVCVSAVEKLRNENQQLREYIGQPSDVPEFNGKRRMFNACVYLWFKERTISLTIANEMGSQKQCSCQF